MQKLLAYPLSILYLFFFFLTLVVFHPIQFICLRLFGYNAHRASVAYLNLCLLRCTHILGARYRFNNPHDIPTDRPAIIVANHQSMHDIPPIIWFLRKHHPKFVSKKELGKGIPSVSYNLRHGGSALIDRKDNKQALQAIADLGKYIEKHQRGAVIFPEGTRSKTGAPKPFKTTGLKLLMKNAPSAIIIPVSIHNSWKMMRYGKFPGGLGNLITFDVHKPIPVSDNFDELIAKTEAVITSALNKPS